MLELIIVLQNIYERIMAFVANKQNAIKSDVFRKDIPPPSPPWLISTAVVTALTNENRISHVYSVLIGAHRYTVCCVSFLVDRYFTNI